MAVLDSAHQEDSKTPPTFLINGVDLRGNQTNGETMTQSTWWGQTSLCGIAPNQKKIEARGQKLTQSPFEMLG